MTKPTETPDATPTTEAPDPLADLQPGRIVFYEPPAHHARHVAGPWVAIVIATQDAGVCTLAVFPPMPVPVGTDPVARLEAVHYSESGEPGTWHWPVRT